MTVTAQMRGHPVFWDPGTQTWRWADDGSLAPASGGEERPCVACGLVAEPGYGPDPCLGWLHGVTGACCGHGDPTQATRLRADHTAGGDATNASGKDCQVETGGGLACARTLDQVPCVDCPTAHHPVRG